MDDCKKQLMDQCRKLADDLTDPPQVTDEGLDPEEEGYLWNEDAYEWQDEDGDPVETYPMSANHVIEDALDINYTMSSDGSFLGAEVTMTTGGPHVYIDTRFNRVVGIWGSDRVDFGYTDNVGLDDYLEEIFQALKESK